MLHFFPCAGGDDDGDGYGCVVVVMKTVVVTVRGIDVCMLQCCSGSRRSGKILFLAFF
jgi:hypothetical protein